MADLPNPAENTLAVQDDDGKDAVFENILETLQSNNILLDEIEENTEDDESETAKRNRRINEENTDKPGVFSKAIGGLGAGVKGVGGILNKANPFQEGGLGTKMSILLISGVLFAISKFGDKLIKPLAEVLEAFDSEGGILDKLKNTELFKGVVATFEKIGERAKLIGEDVKKLLDAAMTVGSLIKSAYESIVAYVSSFDKTGAGPAGQYADGKLDALEMQNLKDDLMKKAQDLVTSIIGTVWNEISFATKLMFAAGGAVSILLQGALVARVAKMIAGVSGKTPPGGDTKPSDAKDNFKSKSKISKILTKAASAFTISSGATASSVGGASAAASAAQGTRLNSAGRLINSKTGRYVAQFGGKTFSLLHLAKYPTALKLVQRLPFLAPIFGGLQALALFNDPNATHDDKIEGLGRIIGGVGGAAIFGKIGAALGALGAIPTGGLSILAGGLVGSVGGYFAGEYMGGKLAQYILGEEPEFPKFNFGDSNLGSTLNASTGTVENLPISNDNAGVNDQYYDSNDVPKMSILGDTPTPLTMDAQLREMDAARAQRHALEQYRMSTMSNTSGETISKLSNTTKSNGDSSALPLNMPVLVDQKEINNINSSYSGSPSTSNSFQPARLFGDSLLIDWRSM